jgi:hypothetical protein
MRLPAAATQGKPGINTPGPPPPRVWPSSGGARRRIRKDCSSTCSVLTSATPSRVKSCPGGSRPAAWCRPAPPAAACGPPPPAALSAQRSQGVAQRAGACAATKRGRGSSVKRRDAPVGRGVWGWGSCDHSALSAMKGVHHPASRAGRSPVRLRACRPSSTRPRYPNYRTPGPRAAARAPGAPPKPTSPKWRCMAARRQPAQPEAYRAIAVRHGRHDGSTHTTAACRRTSENLGEDGFGFGVVIRRRLGRRVQGLVDGCYPVGETGRVGGC